jgi:hypothetical protein
MNFARFAKLTILITLGLPSISWSAGPVVIAESLKVSDTVSGSIKLGRRTMTLPGGTWEVLYNGEHLGTTTGYQQPPALLKLELQEIRNNRLSRLLSIVSAKYSSTANWIDESCKQKGDVFWVNDRGRNLKDQFCTTVGFTSGMVDGARGEKYLAWARDIKSKGIGYSPEMPYIKVTRFNSYDYLQMSMSFDPTSSGIPNSKDRTRQFNDWNPADISQRPLHAKYYEALVVWAPKFADGVNRAFKGDDELTAAEYGEPLLPAQP